MDGVEHPLVSFAAHQGETPPQGPLASRLPRHRTRLPPAPSLTTALAVPTAEERAGVVLVLRVAEAADDRPEALALAHPDGRLTLAMVMMGSVMTQCDSVVFKLKALVMYRVAENGENGGVFAPSEV